MANNLAIITPFYNGYGYLRQVVDSFSKLQRDEFHNVLDEWCWIVVDDGSTEEQAKLCNDLCITNSDLNMIYIGKERGWRKDWNTMQRFYIELARKHNCDNIIIHEQDHIFINNRCLIGAWFDLNKKIKHGQFLKYNWCESMCWYNNVLIASFINGPYFGTAVGAHAFEIPAGMTICSVVKIFDNYYFYPNQRNTVSPGNISHAQFITTVDDLERVYNNMKRVKHPGEAEGEFIKSFDSLGMQVCYYNRMGFSLHIGETAGYKEDNADNQHHDVLARLIDVGRNERVIQRANFGVGSEDILFVDAVAKRIGGQNG